MVGSIALRLLPKLCGWNHENPGFTGEYLNPPVMVGNEKPHFEG